MGQNCQKWLTLFLLNAASVISFLVATLLIKLRLCREPDPWRRTVGTGLRSEASKFGLSAFGVQTRSALTGENLSGDEQHFTRRFAAFLQTEPSARFALRHDRFSCYRVANECADLTLAEFSPSGELLSILPILDDSHSIVLSSSERREVERLIVEEYNRTPVAGVYAGQNLDWECEEAVDRREQTGSRPVAEKGIWRTHFK
jgi:hypothetical protein